MKFLLCILILICPLTSGASAFEPMGKWNKTEIRVCWLTSAVFKTNIDVVDENILDEHAQILTSLELSQIIQNKINQEFTAQKTGIHFIGWKACKLSSTHRVIDADAVIALDSVSEYAGVIEGETSVGMSVVDLFESAHVRRAADSPSLPTLVLHLPPTSKYNSKKISFEDAVLLSSVHEFGHLAGLHHEHMAFQDDALKDPQCTTSDFGSFFKKMVDGARRVYAKDYLENLFELRPSVRTVYDSNSLMSYCQLFQTVATGFDFSATTIQSLPGYYTVDQTHIMNLSDDSLYEIKPSPTVTQPDQMIVHARFGLSKGDNAMLISVYGEHKK